MVERAPYRVDARSPAEAECKLGRSVGVKGPARRCVRARVVIDRHVTEVVWGRELSSTSPLRRG